MQIETLEIKGHNVSFSIIPADYSVGIMAQYCEMISVDGKEIEDEQSAEYLIWNDQIISEVETRQAAAEAAYCRRSV